MAKTIISILSDQLIPNVLFIKQLGSEEDQHIFLSSKEMEEKHKSQILANTLHLKKDDYNTVIIDQNNPQEILEVLQQKISGASNEEYIVNITGGTKMMSQMTYLHFHKFENAKIYYWPIGENYVEQLHPGFKRCYLDTEIKLDLKSYFAAYGYSFTKADKPAFSHDRSSDLMKRVTDAGDSGLVPEIVKVTDPNYRGEDKQYLLGGWFEEWLYESLKNELHLSDNEIGLNLKIKNEASLRLYESDNEIDVAFIYKNTLYIVECKVYSAKQISGKRINDIIYKISSIRQSLGLKATAMVFILSPFGKSKGRKNTIQDLMRMTNVENVFSLEDMNDQKNLFNEIKMLVGYE